MSADQHVARGGWKNSGTCLSSGFYVRIWYLDHKLLLCRAERADLECSLSSTQSRSRGVGSANL